MNNISLNTMSGTSEELKQLVERKLQAKINAGQGSAQAAIQRLMAEAKSAKDFVAPIGISHQGQKPIVDFNREDGGSVQMIVQGQTLNMHKHAVMQLSDKFGIPSRYMKELINGEEWQRDLATGILRKNANWTKRNRFLIRSVNNEVRGVLSDKYRRLNTITLASAFIAAAQQNNATFIDGHMSDTKFFLEMVMPTLVPVPTPKNGVVHLAFGARISSSDYGDGALAVRAFILQGVCSNGLVREQVMNQVHLGRSLPDNLELSRRTYEYDTKTQASLITDVTKGLFSKESIQQKAIEIQEASGMEVDLEKELKVLPQKGILKEEVKEIEQIFMNNNPEDGCSGAATLWKLTQGITAVAREKNPTRERELQEIAGNLMNRVK